MPPKAFNISVNKSINFSSKAVMIYHVSLLVTLLSPWYMKEVHLKIPLIPCAIDKIESLSLQITASKNNCAPQAHSGKSHCVVLHQKCWANKKQPKVLHWSPGNVKKGRNPPGLGTLDTRVFLLELNPAALTLLCDSTEMNLLFCSITIALIQFCHR